MALRIIKRTSLEPAVVAEQPTPAPQLALELAALHVWYQSQLDVLERRTVDIALNGLKQLIEGDARALGPLITKLIQTAIDPVRRAADLEVSVHPSLMELVQESFPAVTVVADPELDPSDCRVASSLGRVDGRLSTRLERLRSVLLPHTDPK